MSKTISTGSEPDITDRLQNGITTLKNMLHPPRTLVWAHRGASGYMPENTLPAFQKAVEQGADGIELDIQLTRDDQIVVIHDELLGRTCEGSGWVKDHTLSQLRKYNYNKTCPACPHADIPLMEEVFELIRPTNLTINIELKTGVVFYPDIEEKILSMTRDYGMEDRVIYSSFNHYSLQRILSLNPQAQTGLLYSEGSSGMPKYAHELGVSAIHPALYNLQYLGYMHQCRHYGLDVNVWTVNQKISMSECVRRGVHAMITNYPDRAVAVAKSRAR